MLAILPQFPGFYNSYISDTIDREIDHYIDWQWERGNESGELEWPESLRIIALPLFNHVQIDKNVIGREFITIYNDLYRDECGIALGLEFESISSPREYNFQTNRLFARIDESVITKMFSALTFDESSSKVFQSVISKNHESCSGFISFYPSELSDWYDKKISEYDHNECCTILEAFYILKTGKPDSLYDDLRDKFYDDSFDLDPHINWQAYESECLTMRQELFLTWRENERENCDNWMSNNFDQFEQLGLNLDNLPSIRCPNTLELPL